MKNRKRDVHFDSGGGCVSAVTQIASSGIQQQRHLPHGTKIERFILHFIYIKKE
jgi:hypothetical protein